MKRAIFYIMKKHYKFSRSLIALFVTFTLLIVAAYAADIKALTQKAQQGDIKSQVELGFMYHEGKGGKKDFKEAAKWWKMAADKNDPAALSHMGTIYALGEGVKKDYKQAINYFQKAAKLGNSEALYNLGVFYANGYGVKKDSNQAVKFYTQAANKGNVAAHII